MIPKVVYLSKRPSSLECFTRYIVMRQRVMHDLKRCEVAITWLQVLKTNCRHLGSHKVPDGYKLVDRFPSMIL